MGFYQFRRIQTINSPIEEIWDFISSPKNLKKITPDYMGFDITSENIPSKMYEGMIISYKVSPLFGIKTTWAGKMAFLGVWASSEEVYSRRTSICITG